MNPSIDKVSTDKSKMKFTLSGVNVSIANGLRRVASELPSVVFRTSPYEKNKSTFITNTTRMNNELLKQRLSCIPIVANSSKFPIDDYMLIVDKQNNSSTIEYVTTNDFKVMNKNTKELDEELKNKMFPPNPLTGDFPEIARLLPRVSETIEGEQLKFTCDFDIGTEQEDSSFNVSSTFVYGNTIDGAKSKKAWDDKKKELSKTMNPDELSFAAKDWELLNSQRYFIEDSFDFTVETVGVLTNAEIVHLSALKMILKLEKFKNEIQSNYSIITPSNTTIPNSFDVLLKNEDYTLGKVIELILYNTHYNKGVTYCGFRKPHPHINESIIRIGFKTPVDTAIIVTYFVNACVEAIRIYNDIAKPFEVSK